jgi:WD40 repeat protein
VNEKANAAKIAAGEHAKQDVMVLRLWDYVSDEEIWSSECINPARCIAYSPDGRLIASSSFFGKTSIQIWSAATGKRLLDLYGHRDGIRRLRFSPDGSLLASASQDTTVLIWDLAAARERLDESPKRRRSDR